jgi:hypothetical protein
MKTRLRKIRCQNEPKFHPFRTRNDHETGLFSDFLEIYPLSSITDGGEGLGRGGVYTLNPQLKILSNYPQSDPVRPNPTQSNQIDRLPVLRQSERIH